MSAIALDPRVTATARDYHGAPMYTVRSKHGSHEAAFVRIAGQHDRLAPTTPWIVVDRANGRTRRFADLEAALAFALTINK